MPRRKPQIYLFNWPTGLGGADTKAEHLVRLLRDEFEWVVVPNAAERLRGAEGERAVAWLHGMGARAAVWEELPKRLEGVGLCLCNTWWLAEGRALEAKQRGLRLVWGNEMMWHHTAELGAISAGVLDAVTYVSPVQRAALEPGYAAACGVPAAELPPPPLAPLAADAPEATALGHGRLGALRWAMVGNWVDPEAFPWVDRSVGRRDAAVVVGRLSRPDPDKFPAGFPRTYERLGLGSRHGTVRFRVMAWSEELARAFAPHRFDPRWDLLPARAEGAAEYLSSLDLFVYELGARFAESWGRSTVEAMLTGAVPLISGGREGLRHHLRHLVPHGTGGFHCQGRRDFAAKARLLAEDPSLRQKMSREASAHARETLCDARRHREVWRTLLLG